MHQKAASLSHRFLYQHKESLNNHHPFFRYSGSRKPRVFSRKSSPHLQHTSRRNLCQCIQFINNDMPRYYLFYAMRVFIPPCHRAHVRVTGWVQEPTSCYWKQCRALQGSAHFAAMGLGSLHGLARPMLVLTDLTCHHVTDLISKMERFRVVTRQWMNLGMNLLEKTQKRVGEETEFGMLMNAKKARMNWCAAILSSSNWKSEEQTLTKRYLMSNLRKFNQWTINDLYINRGGG